MCSLHEQIVIIPFNGKPTSSKKEIIYLETPQSGWIPKLLGKVKRASDKSL